MGHKLLSHKEANRLHVMKLVNAGTMTAAAAAQVLGLTKRQVFRLKTGIRRDGPSALAHGNRGRKPGNATTDEHRRLVVEKATDDYKGGSYEHMAELLGLRDGLKVGPKTVGRILKQAGVAHEHSHRAPKRFRRRERAAAEGVLVQTDASFHDWLEGRAPWLSLHGIVDDATSQILALHFREHEDGIGYFTVLRQVITAHGVPLAIYSDRHTIFLSPKDGKLSIEEQLARKTVKLTQFGRALDQLEIRHIKARTPQAKGRIERLWGTLQERMVLEMRLADIGSLAEANAFLPGFIERYNARFAVPPRQATPGYRAKPHPATLPGIIGFQHERKASKDSTISFEGTTYSLEAKKLRAGASVLVLVDLDGTLRARYDGLRYDLVAWEKPLAPEAAPLLPEKPAPAPRKPPSNHPWKRQAYVACARKEARLSAAGG
jgi:transposase